MIESPNKTESPDEMVIFYTDRFKFIASEILGTVPEKLEFLFTSHKSLKERDEKLLKGLERLGHDVCLTPSVISPPWVSKSRLRNQIMSSRPTVVLIYLITWVIVINLLHALVLLRSVRKIRSADVIYVMNFSDYSIYTASIFGKVFRTPIVFDPHGGVYYSYVEGRTIIATDSIIAKCLHFLDRLGAKVCDVYILGSEAFKQEFVSRFSVVEKKVCVIYTGANESRFESTGEINETDIDILYWGTFIPFHGIEILLDAANNITSDVTIGLIGKTYGLQSEQYLEKLKNVKRENGLDNVQFLGAVSQSELCRHIRSAELVTGYLSDNVYVGLTISNKVGEAAYMGKPILNYGSPAIEEVFTHGESVIVSQSTSSKEIAHLIDSYFDGKYRDIGDRAKERYEEELSAEASARKLLTHLEERGLVTK